MATDTKTISLYNGEVNVVFYPNSHMYKVDGVRVKSVTGVLSIINKPFLLKWAVDLAKGYLLAQVEDRKIIGRDDIFTACSLYQNVKDQAADVGTIIHEWCEKFVKNKIAGNKALTESPDNEQALRGIQGFMEWNKAHKIKYIDSERMVYSKTHKYIGTFDVAYKLDGKIYLGDFKSAKGIYAEHIFQTIAYVMAYEEEAGVKSFDGISVLRFDKDTAQFDSFTLLREDPLYQACEEAFIAAIKLQSVHTRAEKLLYDRVKPIE